MTPELRQETEGKLKLYQQKNKDAKPGQILFVGSSLMEQFPIEKFMKERREEYIVYNRGIGGYRCEDLLKVLDICVFDLSPRRIFINIGTNDLSDPDMPVSDMIELYDRILSEIQKRLPKVELYLMAYYPINYDAAADYMKECLKIRTNEKINLANLEVERLAQRHRARYIDVNDNLKDSAGKLKAEYTIEGMHIKEEGYRAILEDVLRYVQEPAWMAG